jgi:ABC-type transport system involved in multi-copper enzyme maturation permease subunit
MNRNESVKEKKIFSIMVIASFVIGAFFLIFIQYISSNYTQELIRENNYLVQENFRQALQGKDAKGAKRIDARVTGKDTTFLVSFEDKKNKSFQKGTLVYQSLPAERLKRSPLMSRTAFNANLTGDYLAFIMIFILCVGIALCSFIVYQFRQLNRLVIKLDQAEKKTYESLIIK